MKNNTKYHILANYLRKNISQDIYRPGDKLPSENELAMQHGVSRQTVRQALSVLQAEGLVEKKQGSRTTVVEKNSTVPGENNGSKSIAVITTYINEYIFPDILQAVEETLTNSYYHTMVFATKNRVDNERRILLDMLNQPLAGLIIEGTKTALPNPNIDLYNEFESRGIPIVFIHSSYPELVSAVSVTAADKDGGKIATEYLISKNHKRIAGIFKSDDTQGHLRYAGYAEALRTNDLPFVDDKVLWYTTESKKLINVLGMQLLEGCTAVLCYNDEVAMQLMTLCKENGISVPDEISIMSFDNSIYSELSTPKISSCSQQKRQIGVLAAEKIINLINGANQKSSILPWRIIEKESVKTVD